ncbi:MAG: energy-coupling factor ABC transporter permease [Spirochaetes bacterium]|nr:energy-coupling factor ABC transporter permease [Spirochaetota bacterium]
MHIPDGFLDPKTWITFNILSASGITFALNRIKKQIEEKSIPLIGVMAAFIFAAQMINFPVAGGTSGHFMGGVLAGILLGPLTGFVVLSTVLIIQCFIFQDGGLTVLGANIFNMGIIGSVLGTYLYRFFFKLLGSNKNNSLVSAFAGAWFSIVLAAISCAVQLAVSGTVPLITALPAMAGIHALIGIGEGIITVLVLSYIQRVRPDLLEVQKV